MDGSKAGQLPCPEYDNQLFPPGNIVTLLLVAFVPYNLFMPYLGKVKRFYAIFFLSLLLVNGCGFYVYYIIQLGKIKSEMRQALKLLPDNSLEKLTLSRQDYLRSKVEEHEIKVNGKMYDVARIEVSSDSVTLFCIHDEKEDNLIAFVAEFVSKPLKKKNSMPHAIQQFITLLFLLPGNELYFEKRVFNDDLTEYNFSVHEVFSIPLSPPPWSTS